MASRIEITVDDKTKPGLDSVVANHEAAAARIESNPVTVNTEVNASQVAAQIAEITQPKVAKVTITADVEGKAGEAESLFNEKAIAGNAKLAEQAIEQLRGRSELLLAAFRELRENGLENIGEGGVARIRAVANELQQAQVASLKLADSLRVMGEGGGSAAPLAGLAESVEREVRGATTAIELVERKLDEAGEAAHRQAEATAQAFLKEQAAAERTSDIINGVRRRQTEIATEAANKQAEAVAQAFLREEREAAEAEEIMSAATKRLGTEVKDFNVLLAKSAAAADLLAEEIQSIDFPEKEYADAQLLSNEVEKTRHAAELAAEAFEKLGQTDAAAKIRKGLADTADSANQLKAAVANTGVRQLANEMEATGNSAKRTAVDLGAAAREATLAASGFNRLQSAASQAAGRGSRGSGGGQGVLQLAYAVDDMQYGLRGIVNNIPMLVQGLGASAAAAGKLAIAAVVIAQIANHWDDLQKLLQNPRGWQIAKDYAEKAMSQISDVIEANLQAARKGVFDFADSWGLVPDAVKQFADAELEATGKSIVARDKLAAEKAKQAAVEKANAELSEVTAKRNWQNELSRMESGDNAIQVLTTKAKSLRDAINAPTGKGYLTKSPEQIEKEKDQLIEVEGALNRLTEAKARATKTQGEADVEAAIKRQTDFYNSQIKTLDQVRERLEVIETLKKGKSTGVAGAFDLDEKSAKRLHDEEQSLLNLEASLKQAMRSRFQENAQLASELTEKLADQSAELAKQTQLENALHEIEKKRAAIATGADDPKAETQRQQAQASREAFLDRVRAKTEQAKQLADQAANDESLTDAQKKQRRDAYDQAVMNQITAESNARKQSLTEQEALDRERATKNAALDREALEVRQQAAAEAEAEYQRAREEDAAADADRRAGSDERRKKATQDLADASAAKLRAEAELEKQIANNERNRRDLAEKNQQAHTKQRIADEIAVGKAREKALLDAAVREQEIEDAKNARRQAALQQDPRIQQAAKQVAGRIKQKDVNREAMKRRQDEAVKKFIAERQQAGKKVKAGDVKAVRDKAGVKFQKDVKGGKANAELAAVADEMFNKMVDKTRGLAEPVANALKAIAAKVAQDIIDAANKERDVAAVIKAKPGDKAAQRQAEGKAKAEAEKKERENREPARPVEVESAKPVEQIFHDIYTKQDEKKDAEKKALAKKEAEAKRKQEIVNANVADAQERAARENETPEERLAREQREDDEFRRQRSDEHDARQQRAFEAQQQGRSSGDNLVGANGNDEITVDVVADTDEAKRQLDGITKPREVDVRVNVIGDEPPPQRREPEFADGPRPQREEPLFFDNQQPRTPAPVQVQMPTPTPTPTPQLPELPQLPLQQNQQANSAALSAFIASLRQLAESQADADAAVLDALNATTELQTEQSRRQVQLHDVVVQITSHVNQLQQQFLAADDALMLRAMRAGAA